jgi:hypothetical protein
MKIRFLVRDVTGGWAGTLTHEQTDETQPNQALTMIEYSLKHGRG